MPTIDEFVEQIDTETRLLSGDFDIPRPRAPERVDALFHLPLLALALMILARRGQLTTSNMGRGVSVVLTEYFDEFRTARRTLEWSSMLRRRTSEALAFLELASFVKVSEKEPRNVSLAIRGRSVLDAAIRQDSTDLGALVRGISRAVQRARVRGTW